MSTADRHAQDDERRVLDDAARADFRARYGDVDLGPICVIVAAYYEADSVGAVVRAVDPESLGMRVTTLVVDDGSDDGTAEAAEAAGAFICRFDTNRGQGAALRCGYAIAVEHGARYLVSLDADGQYDPAEIPRLVQPLVDNEVDFVSGSRRLGATHQGDAVREAGVVVYAGLIWLLTGRRITDPSFGLRAMTAEVARSVPLRQPQFQAAELLVGAAMRGFRTAERPGVMRARRAGSSHKGSNLTYAYHFGHVVLSTWYRERRRRER
jgi:hypothetical protein